MKLLFCPNCEDIVKLNMRTRFCLCGNVSGRYLDNRLAVYAGDAVPLGIDNKTLLPAITGWKKTGLGLHFDAFTISKECPTFVKDEKAE